MKYLVTSILLLVFVLYLSSCKKADIDNAGTTDKITYDAYDVGTKPNSAPSFSIGTCTWSDCNVSFYVKTAPRGMSMASFKLSIQEALSEWTKHSGIKFTEAPSASNVDILIDFQVGDKAGKTLGHSFYPCTQEQGERAGNIILDIDEDWTTNPSSGTKQPIDIQTVLLHEIGHALGLEHSSEVSSVMYADYKGSHRTLEKDDIDGIKSLYKCNTPSTENGLIAYLPLYVDAKDSKNNMNGEIFGASTTIGCTNKANNALNFKGCPSEDRIVLKNSENIDLKNGFSFAAWIKINELNGMNDCSVCDANNFSQLFFSKNNSDHLYGGLEVTNAKMNLVIGCNGNKATVDVSNENLKEWHHYVFSYSAANKSINIYLDNELILTNKIDIDLNSVTGKPLFLGCSDYSIAGHSNLYAYWYPLNGNMSDVYIYNRSLIANEVKSLIDAKK